MSKDAIAPYSKLHVRGRLVVEHGAHLVERLFVERVSLRYLACRHGHEGAPPHEGTIGLGCCFRRRCTAPAPVLALVLHHGVQPQLFVAQDRCAPPGNFAAHHWQAVGGNLTLVDEGEGVEPRGAAVPVAECAGADVRRRGTAEGDIALLQLAVHVEVHRLAVPIEGEVDAIPGVGLVRHRPEGRASGAEESHVALARELELGDTSVHLIALAQDEMTRV
mmetsp:Transcript_13318/g.35536  ORF Transcript_13318/g.35536 Transcript_13318/m.35536 type:complete len:220 (-) Transcript_13318:644-1303(-)